MMNAVVVVVVGAPVVVVGVVGDDEVALYHPTG